MNDNEPMLIYALLVESLLILCLTYALIKGQPDAINQILTAPTPTARLVYVTPTPAPVSVKTCLAYYGGYCP